MKKFNLFAIGVVAMLMAAVNVSAANIPDQGTLASCLQNTAPEVVECKLTDDDSTLSSGTVTVAGTKTLDLNGKTLTLSGTAGLTIGDNVSLTIKNGTVVATGTTDKVFVVDGEGTLTIDSVTLKGSVDTTNVATVRAINDGGTIKVDNSKFIGASVLVGDNASDASGAHGTKNVKVTITNTTIDNASFAVSVNGNVSKQANALNTITLEGNTFTSDGIVMYAAGYAVWDVKSGTYTGTDVMNVKSGKVTISGGTLTATGTAQSASGVADTVAGFARSYGAVVSVISNNLVPYAGQVELNVTGGTLEADHGNVIYEAAYNGDDLEKISITGGTLKSGDRASKVVFLANAKSNYIKGGEFALAEGQSGSPLQPGAVDNSEFMTGIDKNGNTIVGKPVTIQVTTIGGLNKNYSNITEITAVPGAKINLMSADYLNLNQNDTDKNPANYRLAVKYTLSNGTTGLDEFTMVDDENVTIALEIVEVTRSTKPSETIPTTPTPGEEQGGNQGGNENQGGNSGEGEGNPDTLDNVTSVAAMGGISLAIAAAGIATLKKREN